MSKRKKPDSTTLPHAAQTATSQGRQQQPTTAVPSQMNVLLSAIAPDQANLERRRLYAAANAYTSISTDDAFRTLGLVGAVKTFDSLAAHHQQQSLTAPASQQAWHIEQQQMARLQGRMWRQLVQMEQEEMREGQMDTSTTSIHPDDIRARQIARNNAPRHMQ